jgi:crotonobetainyl-CoA:carnitine CoA-transferase CaiB-like acyl-CoA transferase
VLCETIGRPELATDPRFESAALRREGANSEELFQAIQAAFKTKTQDEWAEAFQVADLVDARVQSPEEVVKDPQIVAALVDVPASPPTNDDGSARDYAHGVVRTVPSPVDFSAAGLAAGGWPSSRSPSPRGRLRRGPSVIMLPHPRLYRESL